MVAGRPFDEQAGHQVSLTPPPARAYKLPRRPGARAPGPIILHIPTFVSKVLMTRNSRRSRMREEPTL